MSVKQKEAEMIVGIYGIAAAMKEAGLSESFIVDAVHLAEKYEGARGLFHLWSEESDGEERDQIVADLQDEIDSHRESSNVRTRKQSLRLSETDNLIERVVNFKTELRHKIDRWGGISKLADATGIPQPSLSRFFSSASVPRASTLNRIGEALDLRDEELRF